MKKDNREFAPGPATGQPGEVTATADSAPGDVRAIEPAGGWPPDEFTGLGGSYVRDPLTGVRRRAVPDAD